MLRALTVAVLLCAAVSFAQGVLTRAPALTTPLEVPYPASLQAQGVGGLVVLELDVGLRGEVLAVTTVESSGRAELDAAVAAALRLARDQDAAVKVMLQPWGESP